ncbi:MAG: class I SAM-dependent methyltransferase [Nannocystaceae bacterium]|nr:class I SAM-dependent methyltransferase [Nannocystaceae bacterium]
MSRQKHIDTGQTWAIPAEMGSLVDYDKCYEEGRGVCGRPFPEFVAFFEGYAKRRADVLDLGCGQGRDALLAARHGHQVLGVDLSAVGIAHLLEDAEQEGLAVQGVVADVLAFKSRRKFDVVLMDRMLHLLPGDDERRTCLQSAARLTRAGGELLIADTPMHRALIHDFFDRRADTWTVNKRTKNMLFASKLARRADARKR